MKTKTLQHPITGPLRELSREDFLELFSPGIRPEILRKAAQSGVEIVVAFELLAEDPTMPKQRTAVNFGPDCSYQVDRIAKGCRLGTDLASIKYPVAFYRVTPPASEPNLAGDLGQVGRRW
jgi:hypothetical protein